MDVSENSEFSPQIIHFNGGFPLFSPSILGGFPPIFGNTYILYSSVKKARQPTLSEVSNVNSLAGGTFRQENRRVWRVQRLAVN